VRSVLPAWLGTLILIAIVCALILRPPRRSSSAAGPWRSAWRRIRGRRAARVGLAIIVTISTVTVLAPALAPYDPTYQPDPVAQAGRPPSIDHPFGTDDVSRDVFSRVLHGARVSLRVALLAVIVSITVGTAYGAIAGFAGGAVDATMMRAIDVMLSIPRILLLILVAVSWERHSVTELTMLIGLTGWFGVSRIVRAQVMTLATRDFVLAARAVGARSPRLLVRHILPNAISPVIVVATLAVGNVIILEAALSFLGIGVQQPAASWGNIIKDGYALIYTAWWVAVFPGIAIVVTVMALNAVGEGLRDALEARDV
jgi:peptide/nickel transport system permease protein